VVLRTRARAGVKWSDDIMDESKSMRRKICIVTGSRAEFGLLRWLMRRIKDHPSLELQIIATGMHLSAEFGLTYREIEEDGFLIDRKVEMLLSSDSPTGITKAMGLGLIGFADALDGLRPDIVVLLGDRFEVFSAAAAALIARIPVAHIHGGETTEGAFDESLRHSITKMSQLHFVAAEEYRHRVIQLGEDPSNVFLVGGLGVDSICRLTLLDRTALEASLRFEFGRRNLLVTFHPVTLEIGTAAAQMQELLCALHELRDTGIIFTLPNADTEGRALIDQINNFTASHPNARAYVSLGQLRYLSTMRLVDGIIGNSSSGLTEAPTFHKGTINIGDRQRGRLKAASVIDCEPDRDAIAAAIAHLYSPAFRAVLDNTRNPYGEGGASDKIVDVLHRHGLIGIQKKRFHDLRAEETAN
jgi:GDP/UDP-N,N'-diacetylbacillosamine 2-epimerase (hydrolysing)